jgi:putative flippase GtrA
MRFLRIYLDAQFARFILAGGAAMALNWVARISLDDVLGYDRAIVVAYAIGMACAYALNRRFVFPSTGRPIRSEILWFVAFNLLAFPFVWMISVSLAPLLAKAVPVEVARALAHGVALASPAFVNFALHKFVTFRRT